jgi:hypothetical protein
MPKRLLLTGYLALLCTAPTLADPVPLSERATFYITPVVEGLGPCIAAQHDETVRRRVHPQSRCGRAGQDTVGMVRSLLDELEPGGADGQVQVGYTLTIDLLSLYRQVNGQWALDTRRVDDYLDLVVRFDRPVVLYLAANHFDSRGPLSEALARDTDNLMLLADGKPPATSYFGYTVVPFTLRTDDDIPVNRYRFAALRHVATRIAALPPVAQARIVAVTLAGELHQMFPDFENGMGRFSPVAVTDYHPRSIAQFRHWLGQRYGDITAFNKTNGFDFASFDAVPAPGRDIRRQRLQSFAEHYDGFAAGQVPISGWLWSPSARVARLMLYLDGRYIADIPLGLNRLDVYRALPEVTTPNVGFRYDLAFDQLAPGRHAAQVVAQVGQQKYQVADFDLHVMARDQSMPAPAKRRLHGPLRPLGALGAGARTWLDWPAPQQDLYFNPLARDWDAFRAQQVYDLLARFHMEASKSGIANAKLFSHQILPEINSTWNERLFAIGTSVDHGLPWHNGLNMYGGATDSHWLRGYLAARGIRDYGVPEFNPQQWKLPGVHLRALRAQYTGGARFVSPYFLSVTAAHDIEDNAVTRMEIRPQNSAEGSAAFYQALREFAAH